MDCLQTPRQPNGIAVISVMTLVLVVAALASAVIWRSTLSLSRVENHRDLAQARWIARAAVDYARWALVADVLGATLETNSLMDHLYEPWAQPIPMASLDRLFDANTHTLPRNDLGMAGFGGQIFDAQSRFNLARVISGTTINAQEQRKADRLLRQAGFRDDQLRAFWNGLERIIQLPQDAQIRRPSPDRELSRLLDSLSLPHTQRQIVGKWIVWLPRPTAVNVNTADAEVIAVIISDESGILAQRLVESRGRVPFRTLAEVNAMLGGKFVVSSGDIDVKSDFFLATGVARFGRIEIGFEALLRRQERQVSLVNYVES